MNNDSELASGASSEEMFANAEPDEETLKAERAEEKKLAEILPQAKDELAAIDAELSKLDTLRDFMKSLRTLPTDMPESNIRAKLESRMNTMNYLLNRRNLIVAALVKEEGESNEYQRLPVPFIPDAPIVKVVKEKSEPRPQGWSAIRAGIRDLLKKSPM